MRAKNGTTSTILQIDVLARENVKSSSRYFGTPVLPFLKLLFVFAGGVYMHWNPTYGEYVRW